MTRLTRVATLFMVAVLAISMVGAFAGTAAAEEEPPIVLAGDGTDALEDFEASEDQPIEHSVEADGADFGEDGTETVTLNVTYDGHEHLTLEADVDAADTEYTFEFDASDLETVPGDAASTTTVDVTTWGEDADGEETTTADEFVVDLEFSNEYAVIYVTEADAEIETKEDGGMFHSMTMGAFGDADEIDVYSYDESVGIDGSNTTVHVHAADGGDEFDDAMDAEAFDGVDNLVGGLSAGADGSYVMSFDDAPDSDLVDGLTYTTYNGDGHFTFNLGDEYDGEDEFEANLDSQSALDAGYDAADVTEMLFENAELSYSSLTDEFGTWSTVLDLGVLPFSFEMPFMAFGSIGLAGLAFAGHRGRVAA